MKRLHIHLSVDDLDASSRFYTALFATEPTVRKPDYAKWMLEDPRVNFAISTRSAKRGLDHLGIQVESAEDLEALRQQLAQTEQAILSQPDTSCCYARSSKHWIADPQGVAWETFHTLEDVPLYGESAAKPQAPDSACCAPKSAPSRSACC